MLNFVTGVLVLNSKHNYDRSSKAFSQVKDRPIARTSLNKIWGNRLSNTCVMRTNYKCLEIYVWGNDQYGQLGLGQQYEGRCYQTPKICCYSLTIVAVSCGYDHSAFLTKRGHIYTIGRNQYGQLGINSEQMNFSSTPCLVESIRDNKCVSLSCGTHHTTAINENGEAFGWGDGRYGQLGNGQTSITIKPTKFISPSSKFTKASCGNRHTVLITNRNQAFVCGDNESGQLGIPSSKGETKVAQIQLSDIISSACGEFHTFLLSEQGVLYASGANSFGQLGIGTKRNQSEFVQITALKNKKIVEIATGSHSAAITQKKELFIWGTGVFGEQLLPIHTEVNSKKNFNTFQEVSVGRGFGAALDNQGYVWSWGGNENGELGSGDSESRQTPTKVKALKGRWVETICCGGGFVLAVGRKRVKQLEPKILSDKIENKKELKDPAKKSKSPATRHIKGREWRKQSIDRLSINSKKQSSISTDKRSISAKLDKKRESVLKLQNSFKEDISFEKSQIKSYSKIDVLKRSQEREREKENRMSSSKKQDDQRKSLNVSDNFKEQYQKQNSKQQLPSSSKKILADQFDRFNKPSDSDTNYNSFKSEGNANKYHHLLLNMSDNNSHLESQRLQERLLKEHLEENIRKEKEKFEIERQIQKKERDTFLKQIYIQKEEINNLRNEVILLQSKSENNYGGEMRTAIQYKDREIHELSKYIKELEIMNQEGERKKNEVENNMRELEVLWQSQQQDMEQLENQLRDKNEELNERNQEIAEKSEQIRQLKDRLQQQEGKNNQIQTILNQELDKQAIQHDVILNSSKKKPSYQKSSINASPLFINSSAEKLKPILTTSRYSNRQNINGSALKSHNSQYQDTLINNGRNNTRQVASFGAQQSQEQGFQAEDNTARSANKVKRSLSFSAERQIYSPPSVQHDFKITSEADSHIFSLSQQVDTQVNLNPPINYSPSLGTVSYNKRLTFNEDKEDTLRHSQYNSNLQISNQRRSIEPQGNGISRERQGHSPITPILIKETYGSNEKIINSSKLNSASAKKLLRLIQDVSPQLLSNSYATPKSSVSFALDKTISNMSSGKLQTKEKEVVNRERSNSGQPKDEFELTDVKKRLAQMRKTKDHVFSDMSELDKKFDKFNLGAPPIQNE